jgi:hypothetical protein
LWKLWFLGKNPGTPVSFMSRVFTLLSARTIEFGRVWSWVLLDLVDWRSSCSLFFLVVYLISLSWGSSCVGDWCFTFVLCVFLFYCRFLPFFLSMNSFKILFKCTSGTSYLSDLSCVFSLYFYIYILYICH